MATAMNDSDDTAFRLLLRHRRDIGHVVHGADDSTVLG